MTAPRLRRLSHHLVLVPLVLFRTAQPVTQPQSLEYEVKAAYLLNFMSYAEWPAESFAGADEPLRMCIASRDPFGGALDRVVQGEQINGRRIVVERLDGDQPANRCALLFLPASVAPGPWLSRAGPHTLTVGESRDFLDCGGIIALTVDAGRVRFDVHVDTAASHKIRLSSRLLRLARNTVRGPVR